MGQSHDAHHVNYLAVFIALCVFTVISAVSDIVQDVFPSRAVLIVVVLAVSCAKAMCVMAFFMHLKFEGNWKYLLLAPTTILAIGIPLALLPDIGMHYYYQTAPQGDVQVVGELEHAADVEHESDGAEKAH